VRFKLPNPKKEKKRTMRNITINIPDIYDVNIQKLIKMNVVPSRSEAIRTALREFFRTEFENLRLLGFFDEYNQKKN